MNNERARDSMVGEEYDSGMCGTELMQASRCRREKVYPVISLAKSSELSAYLPPARMRSDDTGAID